jgi:hypothetical protein
LRAEITAELRLGVSRGFQHILANQQDSGDFDDVHPVAVNALVGLAFLSGGYTERTGPLAYATAMKRGIKALLDRQNRSGYFDDGRSLMYGHGFATLYLAELYGASGADDATLRHALEQAIQVIEGSQAETGGWDHAPAPQFGSSTGTFGASDTSITVCQTMALRAARDLGIKVDAGVIAKARRYIGEAQNDDGGFVTGSRASRAYPFGSSSFPARRRAASSQSGELQLESIKRGFDYLYENYPGPGPTSSLLRAVLLRPGDVPGGGRYWADSRGPGRLSSNGSLPMGPGGPTQENDVQATARRSSSFNCRTGSLPIHER